MAVLCMFLRCGASNHCADAQTAQTNSSLSSVGGLKMPTASKTLQGPPCAQVCAGPRWCPWGSGPHQGQCSLKWADKPRKQSQRSLSRWRKVSTHSTWAVIRYVVAT